jgi:hypothetical protein
MEERQDPKLKIPPESIYKVHLLNKKGEAKDVFVFSYNDEKSISKNDIFSNDEINSFEKNATNLHFLPMFLHKDDSIRIIKKKIIESIGKDKISYDEIYLFADILETIYPEGLFQKVQKTGNFDREQMKQLMRQFRFTEEEVGEVGQRSEPIDFSYFSNYFKNDKIYSCSHSIGQKFIKEKDYRFTPNPFFLSSQPESSFELNLKENYFVSFENMLLMNYGTIKNNTIYLCLVQDVIESLNESAINTNEIVQQIVELYFPHLFKRGIENLEDFLKAKQELINENKNLINKNVLSLYKSVDVFYEIFYGSNKQLAYTERGIQSFEIKILSTLDIFLPLEVIFKNVHSNETIPFIKYNPGNRRENIYRFYTTQKTRDGKNIPFLSEQAIIHLSKEIGKSKEIAFYINEPDLSPIFLIIQYNGDVVIKSAVKTPLLLDQLASLLIRVVNPIIENINSFLETTGYKIRTIRTLKDPYIEIVNLNYSLVYALEKEFNINVINKYSGCISSIFDIEKEENGEILMRYKRVENYREMDAQTLMITETLNRTNNIVDVINVLMKNYKMTEDVANMRLLEYLNEHKDIRGKIVDQPGLPVLFKLSSFDNKLSIIVKNIQSIDYIDPAFIYLDSILRITQTPETTALSKKEILDICKKASKIDKDVDKPHIENIVSTQVIIPQKIQPVKINFDKEIEEIEDDEDYEKGIFFDDDDEEELGILGQVEDYEPDYGNEGIESRGIEEVVETPFIDTSKDIQDTTESPEGIFFEDEEEEDENDYRERVKTPSKTPTKGGMPKKKQQGEEKDDKEKGDKESAVEEGDEAEKEFVVNPVGKNLKYPNLFYNSMKKRDPVLFETEEGSNYEGYSRICQSNLSIQPVVLTKQEFDKINKEYPGSYKDYIKYGSEPDKQNYYICPRYWCLLNNASMTEEDVQNGRCAKQGVPDKIIPRDAKVVPKDAFVYEFKNPKEHIGKNGEYITHYPGFKVGKHPKGFALPCCFKKPKQNWEHNQDEKRGVGRPVEPKKKDADKASFYIISNETFPIKQKNRWGFLPFIIQRFLQTDNQACVTENNPALIKPNTPCLLRYGVEQTNNQSILGFIADLYAHTQNLNYIPTIDALKKIIRENITIDKFIQYNDGNLVSVFRPNKKEYIDIDLTVYEETKFYKSIDLDNDMQYDFLEQTVSSYENFLRFINNKDSKIDHTYLWDMITDDDSDFIKGGVNLVLLEITDNDITDNVKLICPSQKLSKKSFDPRKETVFLLKKDDFYEPIYLYETKENKIEIQRTFLETTTVMKNIRRILNIIMKSANKYCSTLPSMPKVYKFKKNLDVKDIYSILKVHGINVETQVKNSQGKVVGVQIEVGADVEEEEGKRIFIPCYPSVPMKNVEEKYFEEGGVWNDYLSTVDGLKKIQNLAENKVPCAPKFKVIEDKLIVGIITETNQFVMIEPPSENIYDELPEINESNHLISDKTITTSVPQDPERLKMVKKINLESQFYLLFRSKIRNKLNEIENKGTKEKIIKLFDNKVLKENDKLHKIVEQLKTMVGETIAFEIIDDAVLMKLNDISCFENNCGSMKYCIRKENGVCQFVIPKNHLISGHDNERIYFYRVADELLRYKRIRLFMLQPNTFLNISNVDYKIKEDEFILIQNSLNNDYLKNLVPFNKSSYIQNTNYYEALPQISQVYSNEPIKIEEQYAEEIAQNINMNDYVLECIKQTGEVIGNPQESMWKRLLPKKSKEVVFKNTSENCSFMILVYIFQDKYKKVISVRELKASLWNGYSELLKDHKGKILSILKKEGKKKIVAEIENGNADLETAIVSDSYYLTDLDIWVFALKTKIQICLFSKNFLKGLDESLEWMLFGNHYSEPHYFIRSPTINVNKIPSYNLIVPSYKISELGEFETIVQSAVSGRNKDYSKNIQSLKEFIEKYV